jgi:hypothetical protein
MLKIKILEIKFQIGNVAEQAMELNPKRRVFKLPKQNYNLKE